jgi:opacity protein-like surface antigen
MSGQVTRVLRPNKIIGSAACAVLVALVATAPALAADIMPLKAPSAAAAYDWDGFYFGGNIAYRHGNTTATLADPVPASWSNGFGSLYAGVQAGYNFMVRSRVLLGLEADISFANYLSRDDEVTSRATPAQILSDKVDYIATLRGRVGYTFDHWLIYATAGFAVSGARVLQALPGADEDNKALRTRIGGALGAGVEVAVAPGWSTRLEYLYTRFGGISADLPAGTHYESAFDAHALRLGLNRKLDWEQVEASWRKGESPLAAEFPSWGLHGQTTLIEQGYFHFRSPYEGPNSCVTPRARLPSWACGSGRAESFTTRPRSPRAPGSAELSVSAAFPTVRRKKPASRTSTTTRRGCSCGRHSASAASRKPSKTISLISAAKPMYPGSPSPSARSSRRTSSTTTPMPTSPALRF